MDRHVSFKESMSLICLFVVLSMCEDHERSSAMVNPRYFAAERPSSSMLSRT